MTWRSLPPQFPLYLPARLFGPSSAIGEFIIGVSAVGIPEPFDPNFTIISQYGTSPTLTAMISSFNEAESLTAEFESFYDFIWNVQTARGWGLDVLGRIVGVQRSLALPGAIAYVGFGEAGSSWTGWGQGIFYSGSGVSNNFLLDDDQFRLLILAKAAGNISDGSIPSVNAIMLALFPGRGDVYVIDNGNMTMEIHFTFMLTAIERAILGQTNVLPNPAGVVVTITP